MSRERAKKWARFGVMWSGLSGGYEAAMLTIAILHHKQSSTWVHGMCLGIQTAAFFFFSKELKKYE